MAVTLACASCGKPASKDKGEAGAFAFNGPSSSTEPARKAAPLQAPAPAPAPTPTAADPVEALRTMGLPGDALGFHFSETPQCSDAEAANRGSFHCMITIQDLERSYPAAADIGIFDEDLVFEEQSELFTKAIREKTASGLMQVNPKVTLTSPGGQQSAIPMVCAQALKSGSPAMCMMTPNPRMMITTVVGRKENGEVGAEDVTRAQNLNLIILQKVQRIAFPD